MVSLFDPIQIGEIHLPNRVIMAPLLACGAHQSTFHATHVEYYTQRANAGLIISEASVVTAGRWLPM